ncbi:ANTAR domain-containing protein [Streptomyces sp. NPDC004111]|uniref:ANTAR domain-containing protein n=1 Tax=Streptomyces sp. NPDC004111 TaxID=3364690 RepID=UPI0036A6F909
MTASGAIPGLAVVWDERTQQHMEQRARAVVVRAWVVRKRRRAVEMRLRAISMRVSSQTLRTDPPAVPLTLASLERADLPDGEWVDVARVTEQAKGILAVRFRCTPAQALFLLEEHSRRTNQPCAVLAREVVEHRGLAA